MPEQQAAALGFTRTPSEDDPRRDPALLDALERIAPGTELREAIDDVIRSHEGALFVIGDPNELSFLFSGGMRLDQPFTPQFLYELAKMDGAIIVNATLTKIAYANVQLMPDPTIPSNETGTRHRTAERVAKQTGALVISISQQRSTISVYVGQARYQLDPVPEVLAKTNQALATLETYRQRLDQVLTRLTAFEFQNAVVLDDVLVVLQRAEMTTRMAAEIERDCVELGAEARLIRMQLHELVGEVPAERAAVVHDYHADGAGPRAELALEGLHAIPYRAAARVGAPDGAARVCARREPARPLRRRHAAFASSPTSRASPRTSSRRSSPTSATSRRSCAHRSATSRPSAASAAVRAREIREGLRRLQEHNLVDRYLQL